MSLFRSVNLPGFLLGLVVGLLIIFTYQSSVSVQVPNANGGPQHTNGDQAPREARKPPAVGETVTYLKISNGQIKYETGPVRPFKYNNPPANPTPLPVSITELISFTPMEAAATRAGGEETISRHTSLSTTRIASSDPSINGKLSSGSHGQYIASKDLYLHASEQGCPPAMAEAVKKAKAEGTCWKPTPAEEADLVRLNPFGKNEVPGVSCNRTTPYVVVFDSYKKSGGGDGGGGGEIPKCGGAGGSPDSFNYGAYCLGSSSAKSAQKQLPTAIEPLCYPTAAAGDPLVTRSHIVIDYPFATQQHPKRPPVPLKRFLFDIGSASAWEKDVNAATAPDSLHWLYTQFENRGLTFTEISSWRPSWAKHPAPKFFAGTPGHLKPGYHYFNYPPRIEDVPPTEPKPYALGDRQLTAEINKHAVYTPHGTNEGGTANDNPLNHIRLRCAPADLVVLKIHYTYPCAEVDGDGANAGEGLRMTLAWLNTVANDPNLMSLIDEVFAATGDGSSEVSRNIMAVLEKLRAGGIRTHAWV